MPVKESVIRDLIANKLEKFDSSLSLVDTEFEIKLADGRSGFIDVLAKDRLGCITVIEVKKSDQSSRTAVQQLFKYAYLLKKKHRLQSHQIRCVLVSTHWTELLGPYSEFSSVSEYESSGYSIQLTNNNTDFTINEIIPEPESGGGDPLPRFHFYEFKHECDRDNCLDEMKKILGQDVYLNSLLLKINFDPKNPEYMHPYGFSLSTFQGDSNAILNILSEAGEDLNHPDNAGETVESLYLFNKLKNIDFFDRVDGEVNIWGLHTLNNTIQLGVIEDRVAYGPMFSNSLFSNDEILSLALGFVGSHPYNFVASICPSRSSHFRFVRDKLKKFLSGNTRWKEGVAEIFNDMDEESSLEIAIFNPKNFFGMLYDLCEKNETSRIPKLVIVEHKDNTPVHKYIGEIKWNGEDIRSGVLEIINNHYGSADDLSACMISPKLHSNLGVDELVLSEFGCLYEITKHGNHQSEAVNSTGDRAAFSLEDFLKDQGPNILPELNQALDGKIISLRRFNAES